MAHLLQGGREIRAEGRFCKEAPRAFGFAFASSRLIRHAPLPSSFMLLSPLGERLGEGVMQEKAFVLHPLT
jgi:hypothetical protein